VDQSGRAVANRDVTFDLSMPAMAMAPNRPGVTATGDGAYAATTLLSMEGEWRLTVSVGGPGRRVTIPITFSAR
jgi:nitrogen fixation protein FixH